MSKGVLLIIQENVEGGIGFHLMRNKWKCERGDKQMKTTHVYKRMEERELGWLLENE